MISLSINKEKIRDFLYDNKLILSNGILHIDYIPNKKLINASKIYNVNANSVIALYDTTFLKSGKDGLLLCNEFIGFKQAFCSADKISYENLITGGLDKTSKSIVIDNTYIHLNKDEVVNFLMELRRFLVIEDKASKDIYESYIDEKLNSIKGKIQNNTYRGLEMELMTLNRVIIENYNVKTDSTLCYLGCLIYLEKFNFEEVNSYYLKVEKLNQLDEDTMIKLKNDIEKRKVQHEFNLLESKKTKFIEKHKFGDAIDSVNKQKLLNIKPIEVLDMEIEEIKKLREKYIKLLENRVADSLSSNDYKKTFETLNTLKEVNPSESYIKYYILAEIGSFDFVNAMLHINLLSKTDKESADEFKNKLQIEKDKAAKSIKVAVENKNYNFFKENEKLKSFKDQWGMTPLMHFIIKEDLEGIKLLKGEFSKDDTNIIGHTSLNLMILSDSYTFKSEGFRLLDEKLDEMMKKLKTKNTIGKFKKLALNGGELLNNSSIIRYDIEEATASYEESINKSIENVEYEIHSYLDDLISQNIKEFKEFTIKPKDFSLEVNNLSNLKNDIICELENIELNKKAFKNSFMDRLNEALNKNLENYIEEAAVIEIGEKDEFETTVEYKKRTEIKIMDIRESYADNNYIKEKIENLKKEIEKEIEIKLKELNNIIKTKNNELLNLENKIKEYTYLIHCRSAANINEIFNYYYDSYKNNIDIGIYNADIEAFNSKIKDKEIEVKVPLSIAKEFKGQFKNLTPKYEKIVMDENNEVVIQNIFSYEFNNEEVKIPFMKW